MTNTEEKILEILKQKITLTLEGNREFYKLVKYENGRFYEIYGDTMENRETDRKKISKSKALKYFKEYCKKLADKTLETDIEVLEFLEH